MCTKEDTPGSKISTVISFAYVILMDNSVNALCSRVLSHLGRYFKLRYNEIDKTHIFLFDKKLTNFHLFYKFK